MNLPKTITHIKNGSMFKVISMNLGGEVKIQCTDPGTNKLLKKGSRQEIDIDELNKLYIPKEVVN